MQKDYWDISKRNFTSIGVVALFGAIFSGLAPGTAIATQIFFGIVAVLFFVIAFLFKTGSSTAVSLSYICITVAALYLVVDAFLIFSSQTYSAELLVSKVVSLLILLYLFNSTRKASKQNKL